MAFGLLSWRSSAVDGTGWMPRARAALGILLAVAGLFALLGANTAYVSDEVWSLRLVRLPPGEVVAALRDDVHPPLFFFLLQFWTRSFGESEWAVHALTGLLYVLGVLAVFRLTREFFGREEAPTAAAVFLASPLALLAARFARMYALVALLAALSVWVFLRVRRGIPTLRETLLFVAVNVLGTFTHVWFFFLLFAEGVTALLLPGPGRRRTWRIPVAVGASVAPYAVLWLPALLRQLQRSGETAAWLGPPGWRDLPAAALLQGGGFWLLAPLVLAVWWKRGRPSLSLARGPGADLAALAGLTILVPYAISFLKPVFYGRFTIVALPAFAAAAGVWACRAVGEKNRAALTVLLVAAGGVLTAAHALQGEECSSRWTAHYLAERLKPGDVAVFTSLSRMPVDHYLDRIAPNRRTWETSFPPEIDAHPGYEGKCLLPAMRPWLQSEARRLAVELERRLENTPGARLYLFYGYRPQVDRPLLEALAGRFEAVAAECFECSVARNYYRRIGVYRLKSRSRPQEDSRR